MIAASSPPAPPVMIGNVRLANPVVLAPMSGVTDAPFRRLAARLGAGLVVSEMAACAALAAGKRNARLRLEAPGIGRHVVQIAGCETSWMAEGARIAAGEGAEIIDINMGCPARHVTNGECGLGADARPRSCHRPDRCHDRRGRRARDPENAARLGPPLHQRAGTGAAGARRPA